jgi:hypothetical protein
MDPTQIRILLMMTLVSLVFATQAAAHGGLAIALP